MGNMTQVNLKQVRATTRYLLGITDTLPKLSEEVEFDPNNPKHRIAAKHYLTLGHSRPEKTISFKSEGRHSVADTLRAKIVNHYLQLDQV